ncbi:MAG: CDP-alcohol phosphatidyltransferase family protein [Patescibacteria group bacterium]
MAFIKHVPNILSSFRILIAFLLLYFISQEQFSAALVALLTGFLTDLMDGAIARRCNAVTKLGANVLEVAADSSLIFLTILGFIFLGKLPAWIFLVFCIGLALYLPITKFWLKEKGKWITEFYIQPIAYGIFILFVPIYLATRVFGRTISIVLVLSFLASVAWLKRKRLLYFLKGARPPK